jgi:hypothetical protein
MAAVAAVGAVLVAGGLLFGGLLSERDSDDGPPTAAIVDQLSLTFPNPDFVDTATDTFEEGGYVVDYYPGEEVTVELYRDLPTHGYDLIILRAHSGLIRETRWSSTAVFTSEPYSQEKYVAEQRAEHLAIATTYEGGPEVFAIEPSFIESSMRGSFGDATVILMGCDGMSNDRAAEAFLERGAGSYISWDKPVSASHTDTATEALLRQLVTEEEPVEEAVARTMAEVGPDPAFDSKLRFRTAGG